MHASQHLRWSQARRPSQESKLFHYDSQQGVVKDLGVGCLKLTVAEGSVEIQPGHLFVVGEELPGGIRESALAGLKLTGAHGCHDHDGRSIAENPSQRSQVQTQCHLA